MKNYIGKKNLINILMEEYNPNMTFNELLELINKAEKLTQEKDNIQLQSQNKILLEIIKSYQDLLKITEEENRLLIEIIYKNSNLNI